MSLSRQAAALYLVDVRKRHRRHSRTFEVPTNEELDSVAVGDLVKLIWTTGAAGPGERMWVCVTSVAGSRLRGTLDNEPVALEGLLHLGQVVSFRRSNIAQIWTD